MPFDTAASLPNLSWPMLLSDRLYVPDQRSHVCVRQSEIMLVKGARSSIELLLADGNRRVVSTNLTQFGVHLNDTLFVQISRSYIINLLFLEAIHVGRVEVAGQIIPLSPAYRNGLLSRLTRVRLRSETELADSAYQNG